MTSGEGGHRGEQGIPGQRHPLARQEAIMRAYLPPGSASYVVFCACAAGERGGRRRSCEVAAATRKGRTCLTVGNAVPSRDEERVSRTRAVGSRTRPSPGAVRNLVAHRPLRRRRNPSRFPHLSPCAGAQSRTGNLRSGRAHPSSRWLLLSLATFLGPPQDQPFFFSPFPTRRARCRKPGPCPSSVSLPLTHLASVLPPFSVPEAGRSRSADGKSRSCFQ